MKAILWMPLLVVLGAAVGGDEAGKNQSHNVNLGHYAIALPKTWQAAKYNPPKDLVVAIRKNDESKQIGEILAASLSGSVEKESTEFVDSAKKNPAAFSVEESGEFVTKAGAKGKKVLVIIKAKDPNYGSPLVFYSVYLPHPDGGCLTLKLRCGSGVFKALRAEFDDMVGGAASQDSNKADLAKLKGRWKVVKIVHDGEVQVPKNLSDWVFSDNKVEYPSFGTEDEFKVDASKTPKTIDSRVIRKGKATTEHQGIYAVGGDRLKVCIDISDKGRPTAFESKAGSGHRLILLERVKE